MIIRVDLKRAVSPFCWEALRRLPLADAVLSLWAYVMRPAFLQTVFQKHRGRSFEDVLSFPLMVELMSDALLQHEGSGRQACLRADEDHLLPTCIEAFYGKLRRLPVSLSIGFLEEATQRLRALRPAAARSDEQPASLRDLILIMVDGKALKNVAKRLLVSRGRSGKLLGGRLLVAYVPAEGVVPSFAAHEDGEANEARLIPDLIPRARQVIAGTRLWILDRQFCDLTQPRVLAEDGDHFLIRYHSKTSFHADPSRPATASRDAQGRAVCDEWGWLGSPTSKHRRYVRRVHLQRPGEEEVILVSDLLEAGQYPATDLLAAYLQRWSIESVFQQVTEVFELRHFIGSTPQATIFQAAFCFLLFNLLQVIREHLAAAQSTPCRVEDLSLEGLLTDVTRQLVAVLEFVSPEELCRMIPESRSDQELLGHLRRILAVPISKLWKKTKNKNRRPHLKKKQRQSGAHTSVARLIDPAKNPPAKRRSTKKRHATNLTTK